MSGTNYKLLLQFNCDQEINDMPLKENGTKRYCGHCNRNLVDFRNHSIEEILHYKKSLKGEKFCGIFNQEHIRPEIIIQPRFESRKTVFTNSLMVLAALSMLTACQTKESDTTTGTPVEDTETSEQLNSLDTSAETSGNKKGCLTSDTTRTGLTKGVTITGDEAIPEPPHVSGYELEANPPYEVTDVEGKPDEIPSDGILYFAEKMPEFPGGEKKLMEFIQAELKYPEDARAHNIAGIVYVRFIVDEIGEISKPEILRSAHQSLDDPTLAVIKKMPKWTPGEDKGKKVKVYMTIPVSFKL